MLLSGATDISTTMVGPICHACFNAQAASSNILGVIQTMIDESIFTYQDVLGQHLHPWYTLMAGRTLPTILPRLKLYVMTPLIPLLWSPKPLTISLSLWWTIRSCIHIVISRSFEPPATRQSPLQTWILIETSAFSLAS